MPVGQASFGGFKRPVRNVGQFSCQRQLVAKRLGKAVGKRSPKRPTKRCARLVALGLAKPTGRMVGQEIDRHPLPVPPIG